MSIMSPITAAELIREIVDVIEPHGWTVEQFAAADIDDVPDEWRDMHLMTAAVLRWSEP